MWVLPLCREAVGVFYRPSRLGYNSSVPTLEVMDDMERERIKEIHSDCAN